MAKLRTEGCINTRFFHTRHLNVDFLYISNPKLATTEANYVEFIRQLRLTVTEFQRHVKEAQNRSEIDDMMKKLHEEFPRDLQLQSELEGHPINASKLAVQIPQIIMRLKKWIKKIELKVKNSKRYLLLDGTKYIDEDVEIPGQSLAPQEPKTFVKVSKLLGIVLKSIYLGAY